LLQNGFDLFAYANLWMFDLKSPFEIVRGAMAWRSHISEEHLSLAFGTSYVLQSDPFIMKNE
jgi:hypothetical protein